MVGLAIGASAAVSAASSYASSRSQSSAAGKAAGAQREATEMSVEEQRRQFDLTRSDFAPYREVGTSALYALAKLYGLPTGDTGGGGGTAAPPQQQVQWQAGQAQPQGNQWSSATPMNLQDSDGNVYVQLANGAMGYYDKNTGRFQHHDFNGEDGERELMPIPPQYAPQASAATAPAPAASDSGNGTDDPYGGFRASPGYQFAYDEGMRALDRSAAARGSLRGGGFTRAITRYGQGIADQEFNNYANRLASIAGIGQSATQSTAAFGQNSANNISSAYQSGGAGQANALMAGGAARASGYTGIANATNSAVGNYLTYNALKGS